MDRTVISEWAVTLILLLFGTTTLLQAFVIPSGSMEASLLVGDHVLVDKLAYAPADGLTGHWLPYRDVRRGDVIVFRYPLDIKQNFVKRAIGVPGDHIRLVNKQLILNGKAVNEPYTIRVPGSVEPFRDNFPSAAPLERLRPQAAEMIRNFVFDGDLVVPPGFIFAMGDNRDNSDDSRFWGLVPRENIVGTPWIVYWSFEAPTEDLNTGGVGIDHLVDVATHFFSKTRWSRTFKFVRSYPLEP
ncbi:MAG TPA: signal peptidase I [Bryobacteraceae bacterium]|nr:signal peptidase I [Bryobacteraceae bacterium]